ncbi:MAG: carboxypeptidase regulatory-like domain-containing protein, partial [Flavitalea sp.]
MLIQRTVRLLIGVLLFIPFALSAQVTSSSISGIVRSGAGEGLIGATVTATHVPTGTVYSVASRTGGRYNLYNLNPGGPYRIVVTYVGYENQTREDLQLTLGENSTQDFNMSDQAATLTEVVVASTRRASNAKGGSETTISRSKMANLPSVGRNLNDYIRLTPQVKITANGGFSIAGQNNRYNSFLIDGAVNNDVFGLSESGTNGGRSGAPPISIDAIDQIVVQLSPYDASLGNFTGGGINAITRS